ncbi:hypothetical protein IGI04_005995 [Brassica rapa subsp. trilocularis]|uniref:Secreted protein n=1 Tax=Brassica rapa subsp. trilocularis TaxID=1813537 RepID=A0ABQ7NH12_BRACM|nr:hypothetical protein IGI04_005995 [Brassica rapa subsp. trilocularis]
MVSPWKWMLSCTQLMIGIFIRVTDGERLTLAVWFSQDSSHDEDSNLVSRRSQCTYHLNFVSINVPASANMY